MEYSTNPKFNAFVKAYITAMLWSTPGTNAFNEEVESLEGYEIALDTIELIKVDCYNFYKAAFPTLAYLDDKGLHSFELSGHDFWLTRNGHGAGFWDRGLGASGDLLTELSEKAGQCSPVIGDDNLIHI